MDESGKVFQESTMANKDEFAKLVLAIESGVDPQENMNTAIDVFGKKNGPAFVDAIKNGKVNFEDFTETVRGSGDRLTETFEQMRSPTDEFEESLKELKIIGSELGGDIIESSIPIIEEFAKKVSELFDLRPYFIETSLKLRNPIYSETAAYGHMGRKPQVVKKVFTRPGGETKEVEVELFTWEKLDRVEDIKAKFSL